MSDQQQNPRPQPRYGEFAPEGWSWTPPEDASGEVADPSAPATASAGSAGAGSNPTGSNPAESDSAGSGTAGPDATGSGSDAPRTADNNAPPARLKPSSPPPSAQPTGRASPPVAGVPHNLGVGSAASSRGATQQQMPTDGQPPSYRPAAAPPEGGAQMRGGTGRGDRVATIVLLVVATFGALYSATSLMAMTSSFNLIASMLEVENFTVPSSIQTLGTTGALILLGLYAVMLLFSIQRLRTQKLAFWIPLATGALAIIIVIAIMMIAITQMPELLDVLSNPDAAARLLNTGALLGQ